MLPTLVLSSTLVLMPLLSVLIHGVDGFVCHSSSSRHGHQLCSETDSLISSIPPWYSSPSIGRDRSHVLSDNDVQRVLPLDTSRFLLVEDKRGMYHQEATQSGSTAPLLLTFDKTQTLLQDKYGASLLSPPTTADHTDDKNDCLRLLAWVGKLEDIDYWVVHLQHDEELPTLVADNVLIDQIDGSVHDGSSTPDMTIEAKPLREFGDRLSSGTDAAILATANGLVEFHKSHGFCSICGSPTAPQKAGSSRKCVGCRASVYPRIDVASIMLITTRCKQYALLGRKASWPEGRYSTLSGFAEVGETLEQCCVRETLEESGVHVDIGTVQFVCSQPWPFPRSLMIGFRGEVTDAGLPDINVDETELEDVRWFKKDYVASRLEGGSTALSYNPTDSEKEFHIPGKASLARILIRSWALE